MSSQLSENFNPTVGRSFAQKLIKEASYSLRRDLSEDMLCAHSFLGFTEGFTVVESASLEDRIIVGNLVVELALDYLGARSSNREAVLRFIYKLVTKLRSLAEPRSHNIKPQRSNKSAMTQSIGKSVTDEMRQKLDSLRDSLAPAA